MLTCFQPERDKIEIKIAPETQKLNWKLNKSPSTIDEPAVLKKLLTTPPVKKIDLHFPLGLEVAARNLKGVTIKDALDAIHKQFKKKVCISSFNSSSPIPAAGPLTPLIVQEDDELELPVLAGFEWDPEESWTRLIVHQKKEGAPAPKKKGKKGGEEE